MTRVLRGERSEGRRLLGRALQHTTGVHIAARCGVTPNAVYAWAAGRHAPYARTRQMLEEYFALPAGAWDQPAVRP